MTFSSKAWHIRFVRLFDKDYQPKNLCRHFWSVVGRLSLLPILAPLAVVAILVLVIVTSVEYVITLHFQRKDKEPGLVISWMAAKKRRICPLIVVSEDD